MKFYLKITPSLRSESKIYNYTLWTIAFKLVVNYRNQREINYSNYMYTI